MAKEESVFAEGVLVKLSDRPIRKSLTRVGYARMLCERVYLRFCPDCPQYKCGRRCI